MRIGSLEITEPFLLMSAVTENIQLMRQDVADLRKELRRRDVEANDDYFVTISK